MKKPGGLWFLFGFAVTSLLGTLLHFAYDFFGEAAWIAPFSGVNESTFEHMKLLFWPMFIFAAAESFFFPRSKRFWCVNLYGILFGLVLIPIIFYTYNGVIGKSPDPINIAIFFVCAALAYLLMARLFRAESVPCVPSWVALGVLCCIGVLFAVFTFFTPSLAIFMDPVSGGYGIG